LLTSLSSLRYHQKSVRFLYFLFSTDPFLFDYSLDFDGRYQLASGQELRCVRVFLLSVVLDFMLEYRIWTCKGDGMYHGV
jgi:hypothetical protein